MTETTKKLLELSIVDKTAGIYISKEHKLFLWNERPNNFTGKFLQFDYHDRIIKESYFKNGLLDGKQINYIHNVPILNRSVVLLQEYKKGNRHGDFKRWENDKLVKHYVYNNNSKTGVILDG